jgi:uncharacterized protein (TIGR02453 family)
MAKAFFTPAYFAFFRELKRNNNRPWFEKNKARYERDVREALVEFVMAAGPKIKTVSPYFLADPRPVGGSVFRIYRDIRFSKDKTPYKTAGAVHFPHAKRGSGSVPSFYLHLEPGGVFSGVGIWEPDSAALAKIRKAIVEDPDRWKRVTTAKAFRDTFNMEGHRKLKTPPRGYPKDHPFIEDLKRQDFSAGHTFSEKEATAPDFLDRFIATCKTAGPFTKFLTDALGIPF